MPDIHWLPWSAVPFARARAGRKPVLLSIVTGWSRACRAMDDTLYADPAVVAARQRAVHSGPGRCRSPPRHQRALLARRLADDGVPDQRRRAHRRRARSSPSDRIRVSAGAGRGHLRAHGRGSSRRQSRRVADSVPPGVAEPAHPDDELFRGVLATFDPVHGGFGGAPKFPLVGAGSTDARSASGSSRTTTRSTPRSCRSTRWAGARSTTTPAGGFYRCTSDARWREPQREKLLEVNAGLIDLYVEAAHVLGVQRYADRARDALTLRPELARRSGRRRLGRLRARRPDRRA